MSTPAPVKLTRRPSPPSSPELSLVECLERRLLLVSTPQLAITVGNNTPVQNDTSSTATVIQFGTVSQGASTLPSQTFTVKNIGDATGAIISINVNDGAPDFTSDKPTLTLDPGQSGTFKLTLNSTTPGVHLDVLKITVNGDFNLEPDFDFPIQGTVTPAQFAISSSPKSVNGTVSVFDNQDTDGSPRATVQNQFQKFTLSAAANVVSLGVDTTHTTQNGELLNLQVQVLPAAGNATQPDGTQTPIFSQKLVTNAGSGEKASLSTQLNLAAGSYFVVFNAADASGTNGNRFFGTDTENYALTLSATAVVPNITITSAGQAIINGATSTSATNGTNFGSPAVGASTVVETYTVKNTGNGNLSLGSPSLGTAAFDVEQAPPGTLAPGQVGSFAIGLLTASAGQKSDTVTLPTNVSGLNPFTFAISGTVISSQPVAALFDGIQQINNNQPQADAFGSAAVGAAGPTHTFTIKNTGNTTMTVGAVSLPAGFLLLSGPAGSVAPGSSTTFSVQLNTATVGSHSGQVSFTTNDPAAATFTFPVSGSVSPGSSTPAGKLAVSLNGAPITSSTPALEFSSSTQSQPGATETLTVTNSGDGPLTVSSIVLPGGFVLTKSLAGPIAAGASDTFVVSVDTAAVSALAGNVVVTSDGGSLSFPIAAAVVAAPSQGLAVVGVATQKIAAVVVGGQKTSTGTVLVSLKNISGSVLPGAVTVTVFASPLSSSVAGGSLSLGHAIAKLKLKPGSSQVVKVKVAFPAVAADEALFLVAQVTGAGVTLPAGIVGTGPAVTVRKPFVSLVGPNPGGGVSGKHGKPLTISLPLSNRGNVAASGAVAFDLLLATGGA